MTPAPLPRWAAFLHRLAGRVPRPRPGGKVPLHIAIDLHKAATGPFVLALMLMYGVFTPAAWIYLALHGSYGIAWVIKDAVFPDRRWRVRVSVGGAIVALLFLSLYWVAPVILVTEAAAGGGRAPAGRLAAAVAIHTLGLVLMLGADAQKNLMLRLRRAALSGDSGPGGPGLITTGFYRRIRHPNYLGEMLIYGSYALIVDHWLAWAILAAVWTLFFLPNMLAIEASLSRYPEYEAWRARTGFLLPRVDRIRR